MSYFRLPSKSTVQKASSYFPEQNGMVSLSKKLQNTVSSLNICGAQNFFTHCSIIVCLCSALLRAKFLSNHRRIHSGQKDEEKERQELLRAVICYKPPLLSPFLHLPHFPPLPHIKRTLPYMMKRKHHLYLSGGRRLSLVISGKSGPP
jgi:hypothetical protein